MMISMLERERTLNHILSRLHHCFDFKTTITELLEQLKNLSGCSCVGMRLEDQGDFPYYVYDGFPETFIIKETSLCAKDANGNPIKEPGSEDLLLECMCGNIIRSRFDSRLNFFTSKGSFWSNHTSALLAATSEKERQSNTRNYCNSCGYESVALIPIKANEKNIGLLQFNDKIPHRFTLELINFLESVGEILGIFIQNRLMLQKLELSEKLRREADEANLQKSMFLSNMSHEIRTPMNGIIGMTQLLLCTNLSQKQTEMIETIKKSSNLLLRIINDILDLSKIEAGKYMLHEGSFSIFDLLTEVINSSAYLSNQKGIQLKSAVDISIPSLLVGDADRLKQILINLISNGIKFTKKGSVEIVVKKTKTYKDAVQLAFDIIDTGIGISKENESLLFHAFTQLDDSTTKLYQGTGLGLAIAKQLVDLMKGSLTVTSKEGVGSKFSFSIVLKVDHNGISKLSLDSDPIYQSRLLFPKKNVKVLLIEDDAVSRQIMQQFFEGSSVEVLIASNAKEGLEIIKNTPLDLLLLDVQLPDMNGYEISRRVRQGETSFSSLPIIATTAYALEGDREKCLASGMNDYIPKPVNFNLLTELINKYTKQTE